MRGLLVAGQGVLVHGYDDVLDTWFVGAFDGATYARVISDASDVVEIDPLGVGPFGFVQVETADEGSEPWVSTGTVASTALLSDVFPGPGPSDAGRVTRDPAGDVVFIADNGVNGDQIWETDGTEAGTNRLTTSTGQQTRDPIRSPSHGSATQRSSPPRHSRPAPNSGSSAPGWAC